MGELFFVTYIPAHFYRFPKEGVVGGQTIVYRFRTEVKAAQSIKVELGLYLTIKNNCYYMYYRLLNLPYWVFFCDYFYIKVTVHDRF